MNKKKGIIIGILAVILVAAVGYAIFSDTLTIKGTATAQGNFDLTYTCSIEESSTTNAGNCVVDGNTITTTSTFTKPTDTVIYQVTITNNGTIPAVLKTVDSPNNKGQDFISSGDAIFIDDNLLVAYYGFNYGDSDLTGDSAVEAANITIQPEESVMLTIVHGWGDSAVTTGAAQPVIPDDGASINYNLTFGFEQITS